MLNMYINVMNCRTGFPEVAATKLLTFRDLGTIEEAVSQCKADFEAFASRYSGTAPFAEHKDELIALIDKIEHKDQVVSSTSSFRRDDKSLVQRILSVSVRSGDDLPTRRY